MSSQWHILSVHYRLPNSYMLYKCTPDLDNSCQQRAVWQISSVESDSACRDFVVSIYVAVFTLSHWCCQYELYRACDMCIKSQLFCYDLHFMYLCMSNMLWFAFMYVKYLNVKYICFSNNYVLLWFAFMYYVCQMPVSNVKCIFLKSIFMFRYALYFYIARRIINVLESYLCQICMYVCTELSMSMYVCTTIFNFNIVLML